MFGGYSREALITAASIGCCLATARIRKQEELAGIKRVSAHRPNVLPAKPDEPNSRRNRRNRHKK